MELDGKLRVYTDGCCGFCLWARRRLEPCDTSNRIEFRDYNDPVIAQETPFALEELSGRMHVFVPGTGWFAGYRAWIEVLRVLPRWRWLASIAALPPLAWIGPLIYRLIAANRYRIARWLPAAAMPVECDRCHARSPGSSY